MAPLLGGRRGGGVRGWGVPLVAAVAAVAAAALVVTWRASAPGAAALLSGSRLAAAEGRWLAAARAAREAGRERRARTLLAQSRATRGTAQLAARSSQPHLAPAARRAAVEEGQEFDAWTTSWHRTHPGASLAEERAAWHAREGELGRIAAWEARQRRRVATRVQGAAADEPTAVGVGEGRADEIASSPGAHVSDAVETAPAIEDAHVAPVFPANMFRCVARIERGVKGVKASGASSADIMSAVRGAMHKKGIKFSDVEKTLQANGISFHDVAAVVASGSVAGMQRVMKEKHVDMQRVSDMMARHDISCADIADMISSIKREPAAHAPAVEEQPIAGKAHGEDAAGEAQPDHDAAVAGTGTEKEPEVPETAASDAAGGEDGDRGGEEAGGVPEEAVSSKEAGADPAARIEDDLQAEVTKGEAQEEKAEEEVEEGIQANVAQEEEEEKEEEEALLTPQERVQERVAEARKKVADCKRGMPASGRADYLEHRAYWDCARMHIDSEPCAPATFWFEGSIDPRPLCKKPAPTLTYDTPKVMPAEIPPEPFEGEEETAHAAQATVLGVPDGQPDFNGAEAVIAHHPFLGWQPTDLEERGGETRGSFSVVSAPTGFDNEGDVSLAVYGPPKVPRTRAPQSYAQHPKT
jgi:hypothetical protein